MQGAQIRDRSKARPVAIEHRQLTDIPVRLRKVSAIQHPGANVDVRRPSESVRPSVTKRCSFYTVFSAIRDVLGIICENASEALLTKSLYTAGESSS